MDELIGRTLDGKYWPESLLGKGGMGSVYLATHIHTRRRVAVKVIAPQYMNDREFVVRFQREAEAAGRLSHPNVVNVTDFGVADLDGKPMAYLVMEYMDGQTLSDCLRLTPRMPLALAIEVIEQVGLAIDEAHRLGIVHRDLKPDNIWLESNRRGGYNVKVLDFGIAKLNDAFASEPVFEADAFESEPRVKPAAAASDDAATQEIVVTKPPKASTILDSAEFSTTVGTVLGTPAYMSPEQCRGDSAEGASDIYSLGVIAYQLLTGELPFEGKGLEMVRQHLEDMARTPRERCGDIGEELSAVVMVALEKEPQIRPVTAAAFSASLRVHVDGVRRLVRESRDISSRAPILFLMLPLLFLPGVLTVAFLGPWVPWWAVGAFYLVYDALMLSAATGASALAFRQMRSTGDISLDARLLFREFVGLLPKMMIVQLLWLMQPWKWVSGILWAAVLVFEGRSGSDALQRSAYLTGPFRAMALEIVVRLFAISMIAALYFPLVISFAGARLEVITVLLASSPLFARFFLALAPISFNFWFLAYSGAVPVLYLWARSACGEPLAAAVDFAKNTPGKVKRSNTTFIWMALPFAIMVLIGIGQYRLTLESQAPELTDAAAEGRLQAVRKAIARGVDVNSRGKAKRTALTYAAERGNVEMVKVLLEAGANVELSDTSQRTALHRGVAARSAEVVRILLLRGAKVDAADDDGVTPLLVAVRASEVELVRILRQAGADADKKDDRGKSARDYAREEGNAAVLEVLKN